MISHFFIDRPIFAAVLSIVLTLAGLISVTALPVAQYPDITPPTVLVTASYPGANAQTVLDTVAAPIEQQVSGVENAEYMSSQCTNDGTYTLLVTFKLGMNPDMAQVLTQNRVQLALPVIPDLVQRESVSVKKISPSTMMIVNLVADPDESGKPVYNDIYVSNYAMIQVRDELLRLEGVANVTFMGERDYSMRAWLDPNKLSILQLTAGDVVAAIAAQNVQVAAGSIGQEPVPPGQQFQLIINTLGRLVTVQQFEDIIIKVGEGGPQGQSASVVRLRDVARIDLGAQEYDQTCTLDGRPSVALSIFQLPGSNALKTAQGVYQKMKQLKERFPKGLNYKIVYDTTPFIKESILEVFKTLIDAIVLVAIVVLVFLQSWRATLIPLVAVPVAVVGTFTVMAALGFSLNNLSLFGLVLAIGIVVDDAIVVVENVERWLEHGLPPREAARRAMNEVTGPVIAVALVLCAVFVPCAFITGITGQFFKQFAITIAVSTVISAFNSLTLSPALAAILLKPKTHTSPERQRRDGPHKPGAEATGQSDDPVAGAPGLCDRPKGSFDWVTFVLFIVIGFGLPFYLRHSYRLGEEWPTWLFGAVWCPIGAVVGGATFLGFNWTFDRITGAYTAVVSLVVRLSVVVLIGYGGLLWLTYHSFVTSPTGFIPSQDKGYLLLNVQLPDASSVQRTMAVMAQLDLLVRGDKYDREHYPGIEGVKHTVSISGQSLLLGANAPNFGSMNVMLKPFEERRGLTADQIGDRIRNLCRQKISDAMVTVFGAPPIDGLGTAGGFKVMIEDRGPLGLAELQRVSDKVVVAGNDNKKSLQGVFTNLRASTPWLYLDINRDKCISMGISLGDVFQALQVYLGSYYVNNFNRFGRMWQVNIQADDRFRNQIAEIALIKVRNSKGQMAPLSSIAEVTPSTGPVLLMRYNMYSASAIFGNNRPGVSSGDGIKAMDAAIKSALPPAMSPEWTELTYMQLQAGNTAMFVFGLAVVFVFLVLAAQYESWSLPLAVILVVPMCLLCSVVGVNLDRSDVNIFVQIGFVVLVGLASKNAILIVEFAKQQRESGVESFKATTEACRLRLRPILMTSFAFILGVVPLVIAQGAGAEMRRQLGVAVFSGMLGVTFFGIFLTPVFYYVIQLFSDMRGPKPSGEHAVPPGHGADTHGATVVGDGQQAGPATAIQEKPGHGS